METVCKAALMALALGVLADTAVRAQTQNFDFHQPTYPQHLGPPVHQASAASTADLLNRIEALEAFAEEKKKEEKKEEKKDGTVCGWKYGEWTDTSGEKWSYKIEGRLHLDWYQYPNDESVIAPAAPDLQNFVDVRRLRLDFSGEGYGVYEWKMYFDFQEGARGVLVRELYTGIKDIPLLGAVRFGNHKTPNSMEQIGSSNAQVFMERGLPNVFIPRQRFGVTQVGMTENKLATYSFGAYFEDVNQFEKNRFDDEQGLILAGRVTYLPWYDEPSNGRYLAHVGASFAYTDDQNDRVNFSAVDETSTDQDSRGIFRPFISTGDLAAKDWWLWGVEGAFQAGSFSMQGEAYWAHVNDATKPDGADLYGAYVWASYFLTGEHRPYKHAIAAFDTIKPHENFWFVPGSVGKGAWELSMRWSYLDFTEDDIGQTDRLHDITLGLNWYWNPNTRIMFNWIHAIQDDNAQLHNSDTIGTSFRYFF